jgi:hypothetical protein
VFLTPRCRVVPAEAIATVENSAAAENSHSNVGFIGLRSSFRQQAHEAGANRRQTMRVMVLVKATESAVNNGQSIERDSFFIVWSDMESQDLWV